MKKASGGRKPPDDPTTAPTKNQEPGTKNTDPKTNLKRQTALTNNTLSAQTQVLAWMIAGNSERDIIDGLQETYPGLDPQPLLVAAFEYFKAVGEVGDATLIATYGWAIEAMKDVYRQLCEIGDYAGAATAIMKVVNLADRAATLQ